MQAERKCYLLIDKVSSVLFDPDELNDDLEDYYDNLDSYDDSQKQVGFHYHVMQNQVPIKIYLDINRAYKTANQLNQQDSMDKEFRLHTYYVMELPLDLAQTFVTKLEEKKGDKNE